jgi:uncharacterized tellurite resistance protein B-like protein
LINKLLSLIKSKDSGSTIIPEHCIFVAAISLLIEVAKADHHLSIEEETKLLELVSKHFNESNQEHHELISLAKSKSENSTSLYEFTSVINECYSESEKFQLVILMWKIAYIDDVIDKYEEHLIRRVADLIYLSHSKFIEAKHIAKND